METFLTLFKTFFSVLLTTVTNFNNGFIQCHPNYNNTISLVNIGQNINLDVSEYNVCGGCYNQKLSNINDTADITNVNKYNKMNKNIINNQNYGQIKVRDEERNPKLLLNLQRWRKIINKIIKDIKENEYSIIVASLPSSKSNSLYIIESLVWFYKSIRNNLIFLLYKLQNRLKIFKNSLMKSNDSRKKYYNYVNNSNNIDYKILKDAAITLSINLVIQTFLNIKEDVALSNATPLSILLNCMKNYNLYDINSNLNVRLVKCKHLASNYYTTNKSLDRPLPKAPYVFDIFSSSLRLYIPFAIIYAVFALFAIIPKKEFFDYQNALLTGVIGTFLGSHILVMIPGIPEFITDSKLLILSIGLLLGGSLGALYYLNIGRNIVYSVSSGYVVGFFLSIVIGNFFSLNEWYYGIIFLVVGISAMIAMSIFDSEMSMKVNRGVCGGFLLLLAFDICTILLNMINCMHDSNMFPFTILRMVYIVLWILITTVCILLQYDRAMVESYIGYKLGDEAGNGYFEKVQQSGNDLEKEKV